MKNQMQPLLQGIRDLHIKILQSNNLHEIGTYLQQVLDKVVEVSPEYNEKVRSKYWKDVTTSNVIGVLKTDIKSILEGAYSRVEVAKHKATLDIAWLKGLFAEPTAQ